MTEAEKKESSKKGRFKKHNAFNRQKNRTSSFKGFRKSHIDPKVLIESHHTGRKVEIGQRVAICTIILLAVLFSYAGFDRWSRSNIRSQKIADLMQSVNDCSIKMEENIGYEKTSLALDAITLLAKAKDIQPNLTEFFNAKIKKFRKVIEDSVPLKNQNFINEKSLISFVNIKHGEFNMGRKPYEFGKYDELPQRKVKISYDFWMAKTETTNFQIRQLFPNHRLEPWGDYIIDSDSQPAVKIDWNTAIIFCRLLTQDAKKKNELPKGYEYRLPTEAEWEYTCRAETDTRYYWGQDFGVVGATFANTLDKMTSQKLDWGTSRQATPYDKYIVAAPVGSFEPNEFGLYDMNGNVWEWCWDWYNPKAYSELPSVDPVQTQPIETILTQRDAYDAGYNTITATAKVIRGGSWGNLPADCRSANRDFMEPNAKLTINIPGDGTQGKKVTGGDTGIGFRVVLAPVINSQSRQQ